MQIRRMVRAILAALSLAAMTGGTVMAQTSSGTPTLHVSCAAPPQVDAVALCTALREALPDWAPGYTLAATDPADPAPVQDDDARLTLQVEAMTALGFAGHLVWEQAGQPAVIGPTVSFDVMDSTLSPAQYPGFIRGLLRATPKP